MIAANHASKGAALQRNAVSNFPALYLSNTLIGGWRCAPDSVSCVQADAVGYGALRQLGPGSFVAEVAGRIDVKGG